jgi:hypothetical protein
LELNAQVKNKATTNTTAIVPAITVDELTQRHGLPNVLLIDVEGHECHALRGASQTMAHKPDCCVEVHAGCGLELAGGSLAELFGYFPATEYELFAWREGEVAPAPITNLEACPSGRFFLAALARRSFPE